ncbi:aldose 1-epimerase family protein [Butyrivibrio sp. AE3006]|uniref:aldose 1-epimerase family protein n=1 Tax=Butyrivibrio sp. AE3006 TaxID=1280673 RepID=UPI0004035C17|nr:aldose 1-epimerase family protein [Butyrivibrio sp. AE3006]
MRIVLKNEILEVSIESKGAEIKSVVKDGKERMWHGDPKFWGRTSPVLFPFVGSVAEGKYRAKGQEFPMGQHGFARDMEHELVESSADFAHYRLVSNEETRAKYPFDFCLEITYKLVGNEITIGWKVTNTGSETLHYAIGAHPAFNCELDENGTLKGNSVVFDTDKDVLTVRKFHDPLAAKATCELPLPADKSIAVDEHTFDNGAIILENSQAKGVGIKDASGKLFIKLTFDAPLLGVWSPSGKNAPFICLEPWYGRADAEGFTGDISEREFEQHLEPGEAFTTEYKAIYY